MFRYLAFMWNTADADASAAAHSMTSVLRRRPSGWECVYEHIGIEVFCTGMHAQASTACVLQEKGGVVLGTLFDRVQTGELATRRTHMSVRESRSIRATHGRELIKNYWGRYVAIVRDADPNTTYVIRDPSGGIDCFSTSAHNVQVYFSSLRECASLDGVRFSVDWEYVMAAACGQLPESRSTGLKEISRVLRGECIGLRGSKREKSFYWNPVDVARSVADDSFDSLARELRETTRTSVQSWASCYDGILQFLSGGLDSSIVLSCLHDTPLSPRITCLNYYYKSDSGGDERRFARMMADHVSRPLIEHELNPRFRIEGIWKAPPSPTPTELVPYYGVHRIEERFATECQASARFHGFGGDQVFYQNGAQLAVADYLVRRSLRPELMRVAFESARVEESTIWRMLKEAARLAFFRSRFAPALDAWTVSTIVRHEVSESVLRRMPFIHPWLIESRDVLPGKFWQIYLLSANEGTYGPFAEPGDPENVYPLFSQPVMELCLRIPTYVLLSGGWDRAVARRAFGGDLPNQIARRRSKGAVREYPKAILEHNRSFIRETLLNGALVREQILDRTSLETALSGEVTKHDTHPPVFFAWVSIEAWLEQRASSSLRAAAA